MLGPGVPGLPCVADQDTVVWVTSCGCQDPVKVQIVRGLRASVTSATIGFLAPCIRTTASAAAGDPEHVACIAAQAGTATGLGVGEAVGEGDGDGLGVGLGEGLGPADGEGDGLACGARGPFAVQPATASRTPKAANPLLTRGRNAGAPPDVTRATLLCTGLRISMSFQIAFSDRLRIGSNEQMGEMKAGGLAVLVLLLAACEVPPMLTAPPTLTASVTVAATQSAPIGGQAQLVITVTNTGPVIPHLGLVFMTADKWYDDHTVIALAGCTVAADTSAFDCGDLGAGQTASFSFAGTAKKAGTFHYELALRELVHPFDYVNDHPGGADVQSWDETIGPPHK
jgi:hypothetical protein